MPAFNRRSFLIASGALPLVPAEAAPRDAALIEIPDQDWRLVIDRAAEWKNDEVFLPADVRLARLPVHPPSGGWGMLDEGLAVTLPTTVEQHCWGQFGARPYTPDEYRYADDDKVPRNGAYAGVSWWVKDIAIPASARGKRAILTVRGARLRAEVFLNRKLVGYSLLAELPFDCDLTAAMKPGKTNRLAIRITNPGGRYDWKDSGTVTWGKVKFYPGHGFGGLDRGLSIAFVPRDAHIADAWVLNTQEPRMVTGFMEVAPAVMPKSLDGLKAKASAALFEAASGKPVPAKISVQTIERKGTRLLVRIAIAAPGARLWDLATPELYRLRFKWGDAIRDVRFGLRWFAPEGIGHDAMLKLNGKRIKLYSAISWGYWGFNGLWPTPDLARREVEAAKTLGLNCLHFHRNLGRHDVLDRQDEMGLLRVMEPGAGRGAIGAKNRTPADTFARDYEVARCVGMVKAFRSHPSLVQYTLQNEISGDLANPDLEAVMAAMREADPSRTVLLNDGFVGRGAAQAMFRPYDAVFHRSDKEPFAGWWVNHQGAGDQWYDAFYQGKDSFIHRQPDKAAIVEFGEMEGCAVCDNHTLEAAEILAHGGKSYDLEDHRAVVVGTNEFLEQSGFRASFATAEALFRAVGKKQYDSWANYLENIRIGDSVDMACISGWETTAIENHSGIVSNLRHFHGDPGLIRASLLPVRPVAKQRKLAYALGEKAVLDLWLLNDTDTPVEGTLVLSVETPDGSRREVMRVPAPAHVPGQFSYLLAENVATPAFDREGLHVIRFELGGVPAFTREVWVTDAKLPLEHATRIAVSGIAKSLRAHLDGVADLSIEDYAGWGCDGIVASGLTTDDIANRQIGEETGNEQRPSNGERPALVAGELPQWVLESVKDGIPLIAIVPDDGLADGVAKQLAALGLFTYSGQVGDLRAPWMGNWNFLKRHPLTNGIPADMAAGVLHQIPGKPSNGLIVEGENLDVIAGYSRDHDRRVGAASFIARKGRMRVLVHRLPDMAEPLQTRWLRNAINWLA
jgi:beta-galactosidase